MSVEEIKIEFKKLAEMLSAWQEGEQIASIERDLALDKLKKIYDALKFDSKLEAEPTSPKKAEHEATIPAPLSEPETEEADEDEDSDVEVEFIFADEDEEADESMENEENEEAETEAEADEQTPAEVVAEPKVQTAEPKAEVAASKAEPEVAKEVAEPKVTFEPAPAPAVSAHEPVHVHVHVHAPATVTTPAVETPAPAPAPTVAPVSEVAEPKAEVETESANTENMETAEPAKSAPQMLFAPEEVVRKPRSKHQRMMSIYNDQPSKPEEKVVDISKIFDAEPTAPKRESVAVKTAPTKNAEPAPKAEEQKVVTLADAIAPSAPTLAETLATPTPLAEEITHGNIRSLTDAIGINDQFLMIRDLFDGDSQAYKEAIATLDKFEEFDDCMIYIVENFAWNPDSEGAKFIMQLLERKLS